MQVQIDTMERHVKIQLEIQDVDWKIIMERFHLIFRVLATALNSNDEGVEDVESHL